MSRPCPNLPTVLWVCISSVWKAVKITHACGAESRPAGAWYSARSRGYRRNLCYSKPSVFGTSGRAQGRITRVLFIGAPLIYRARA